MSKKIISVLLAVVMVLAMGTVALVSVSADLASLPEQPADTYRYYFYMPDQWYNDYAYTAGIYWWEGTGAHTAWPGMEVSKADAEGVYYCDVPTDVSMIIWNNYVDGGQDPTLSIYQAAVQTKNIPCEYYDPGESALYPDGTDNFDGMIYVTDCDQVDFDPYGGKMTYGGEWYYYYGDGKYGTAKAEADAEIVYTDPAFNLDNFQIDTGSASGDEPTVAPTVAPTEAPTAAPTEAPTAAPTAAPTEAPTAAPVEYGKVIVGDKEYPVSVGDVITYTYTLTTPANIENVQATTYYDADKLELIIPESKPTNVMFPVLRDMSSVTYNAAIPGEVKFNSTEGVDAGFDFTQGGILATFQFKVLDNSADATISTTIEEMVKFQEKVDYATGGQIVADGVVGVETLEGGTEPVVPTEAPTAAPTTAAPTTVAPTEAPTKAPVEPTKAPVEPTEAPTKAPTQAPDEDPTSVVEPGTTDKPADAPNTGAAAYIYVVVAVLAMAACAVVVLRKRVNG